MCDNKYRDIDSENINMVAKIISDSQKIKLNPNTDKKIIEKIKDNREKKKSIKKIYRMGIAVAACIVLAVGLMAWNQAQMGKIGDVNKASEGTTVVQEDNKKLVSSVTGKVAASYEEIKDKIDNINDVSVDEEVLSADSMMNGTNTDDFAPEISSGKVNNSSSKSEGNYSDTNVQTKGVDEGDIVKTDGQYIYTLSEKETENDSVFYRVIITEVSGKKMEKVSTINISNKLIDENSRVIEMYLNADKLVVIASKSYYTCGVVEDSNTKESAVTSDTYTIVLIYDLSDIKSPKLISKNKQDGYYTDSRLADGYLYTMSSWRVYDSDKEYIPKVNGKNLPLDDIYLPEIANEATYTVITSINVEVGKDVKDCISILGNGNKIYVSQNNIYLVNETCDEKDLSDTEEGKKLIRKYLKKRNIKLKGKASKEEIEELKEDFANDYDFSSVSKKFEVTITEYSYQMEILKYHYEKGELIFVADCDLDGNTDDRFSLDEKDGYLRLVANVNKGRELSAAYVYYDANKKEITENYYDSKELKGDINSNTVYTLDENLNKKGEISGLAEDEEIYAARYLGDYGYFVTYEQTDPLFTVDFTDMDHPKVIGKLKMSGFSDYLQFYNDKLLFGIGMDDTQNRDMSAIKLDMYNVAKGSAKCETTLTLSETIESPALYNSKALLMDSDRNIIGFPAVDFVGNDNEYKVEGYYNLFSYKKGAFHLLKKITIEEDVVYETRGLYINNYLYIVTPKQIQAVNMKNYKVMGKISIK